MARPGNSKPNSSPAVQREEHLIKFERAPRGITPQDTEETKVWRRKPAGQREQGSRIHWYNRVSGPSSNARQMAFPERPAQSGFARKRLPPDISQSFRAAGISSPTLLSSFPRLSFAYSYDGAINQKIIRFWRLSKRRPPPFQALAAAHLLMRLAVGDRDTRGRCILFCRPLSSKAPKLWCKHR
jgi:hypothetical protein